MTDVLDGSLDLANANFDCRTGERRVREAYGPHYDRLVALKKKYDPANLFRLNSNIKPEVVVARDYPTRRGQPVLDERVGADGRRRRFRPASFVSLPEQARPDLHSEGHNIVDRQPD